MRVEAIDFTMANAMASQIHYLDLKKLTPRISSSSLNKNDTGVRLLEENHYRGIDLYEVIQALHLNRADTRFMILNLLKRSDLMEILYLLDKGMLINGLRFFDKRKLLALMMRLPKRMLIRMLRHLFSIEELIGKMPTSELFNILRSDRLPNRELIKAFYKMDMRFLLLLMSKIFDQDMSGLKHAEILDILFKLKKHQIIEGLKFLPFRALIPMVTSLVKSQPDLLENMSLAFIGKLFSNMSKATMLESFEVLPNDIIIEQFLSQLPDKFLVLVAAQIDPSVFEDYLLSRQSNLLAILGAAQAA